MKPRFLFATKRRVVVAALGATALLALGGSGAFAAFTTQTTSTQQVTAGTYRWAITEVGSSPASGPPALYPGLGPQDFTFSVMDSGTLHERFLNADLSATVTSHVTGCPPSDFVTSFNTNGHTGTTLAPGATVTVTVSVGLNTALTENACQGTKPTVSLTIKGSD